MSTFARTPVLLEATLVGAVPAQLRRPRPRSAMSGQRRFATLNSVATTFRFGSILRVRRSIPDSLALPRGGSDLRRPSPSGAAGGRRRRRCSGSPSRAGQRHSACQRASRETCVLRTSRPFRVAVRLRRPLFLGGLVAADHARSPRKELAMRNRDQHEGAHGGGGAGAEQNGDRVRQWR
jgi:hypothetical protein